MPCSSDPHRTLLCTTIGELYYPAQFLPHPCLAAVPICRSHNDILLYITTSHVGSDWSMKSSSAHILITADQRDP